MRKTFYPVVDHVPTDQRKSLGMDDKDYGRPSATLDMAGRGVRAVATGEKRAPKLGEWYLSGAVVGAYLATTDRITIKYPIARLVMTKTTTVITEHIVERARVEGRRRL